ncbi:amine dehydrogenase large subunit [Haliea sp. E1-2-M8]|uniref:amine dehydrogenase large subunit n=1 Tax=Haliea sp. E1-2-M8 TaxID=3064706 RepID=UPI0027198B56|nr:amine dehydrogenase large subunit [Haliea sp. E1-2-M8]MDO8861964.1 amine dehydrogenase large subunit [Haliea sp. E1-2-M8]
MWNGSETRAVAAVLCGLMGAGQALAADKPLPPPLPVEPIGIVETLPREYPASWFLVHDAAFFHMSDGKVWVLDTAEDTVARQVQGTFNVSMIGNIQQSPSRAEIYATETFQTRGTRGERIDVLTIWDQENLSPVAEVVLPQGKRFMGLPERDALLLLNDDRWLAVANFSPAASVTLVDLEERKIIGDIGTPGCVLTYPAGKRGFSSLCADGRFLSTELAEDGSVVAQVRTDAFFDSDDSPIFERPAYVGDMAYFPTFAGEVIPVDVSGKVARVGEPWHLVPEAEREQGWAPGGIGITGEDDLGRFYVLMHPDATDGSHNGGGAEVWIYNPEKQTRVARIALREWGLSLAVSRGPEPKLLVTNPVNMSLELYDAQSGDFLKTIPDLGQNTPLMLFGAR